MAVSPLPWIKIYASLVNHEKSRALAKILDCDRAWTHVVELFLWASQNAPDGNLSRTRDTAIGIAAGWYEKPDRFPAALREVGFLGDDGVLHDWRKEQEAHVKRREKERDRQRKLRAANKEGPNGTLRNTREDTQLRTRDTAIGIAAGWYEKPDRFPAALREVGFLGDDGVLHDWRKEQEAHVKRREKERDRQRKLRAANKEGPNGTLRNTREDTQLRTRDSTQDALLHVDRRSKNEDQDHTHTAVPPFPADVLAIWEAFREAEPAAASLPTIHDADSIIRPAIAREGLQRLLDSIRGNRLDEDFIRPANARFRPLRTWLGPDRVRMGITLLTGGQEPTKPSRKQSGGKSTHATAAVNAPYQAEIDEMVRKAEMEEANGQ